MTKLYELTEAYMELMTQLEECESDADEAAVAAQIDAVSDDIARKGEAFARIMRNLQTDMDGYDAEIKRLQKRKAAAKNGIERLKNHIIFSMGIAGASELHTSIGKWRLVQNPPKVVVNDEAQVDDAFLTYPPAEVSKEKIISHWRATGEIPAGCEIVQADGIRFR